MVVPCLYIPVPQKCGTVSVLFWANYYRNHWPTSLKMRDGIILGQLLPHTHTHYSGPIITTHTHTIFWANYYRNNWPTSLAKICLKSCASSIARSVLPLCWGCGGVGWGGERRECECERGSLMQCEEGVEKWKMKHEKWHHETRHLKKTHEKRDTEEKKKTTIGPRSRT